MPRTNDMPRAFVALALGIAGAVAELSPTERAFIDVPDNTSAASRSEALASLFLSSLLPFLVTPLGVSHATPRRGLISRRSVLRFSSRRRDGRRAPRQPLHAHVQAARRRHARRPRERRVRARAVPSGRVRRRDDRAARRAAQLPDRPAVSRVVSFRAAPARRALRLTRIARCSVIRASRAVAAPPPPVVFLSLSCASLKSQR